MRKILPTGILLAALAIAGFGPPFELGPLSAPSAWAGEAEGQQQRTRRVPSMSEATFKKLAEAQELIDAKPPNLAGALRVLNGMLDRSSRYNGNEIGQIHNMLGFVHFSREDYPKAIEHYQIVLRQGDEITEGLETTTLYTLAQLSFVDERYDDALRYMQQWISKAQNPGPDPHIFMGQVHYQKADYPNATAQVEKGVNIALERGTPVKENWWALLNYLYYEQEIWPKVLETLEILVRQFPKRQYWIQLAGVHGQQGNDKQQAYVMMAAYEGGFLEKESDLMTLAGLLMQEEAPIRAAAVISKGIDEQIIKKNDQHLRTLGQAYQLAQEVHLAIPVFEEAAKLADEGDIYERLAQLYLEDDDFGKCVSSADNALKKGGLRKKQSVHIVRGMCEYNRKKLSAARGAFASCRNESRRVRDEANQRICQNWISFIDSEIDRQRKLAAAI